MTQKTHTFFATLRSRWARSKSKERNKSKETSFFRSHESKNVGVESDYAADYSSEHSHSSSATQSPAKHYLDHPGKFEILFNYKIVAVITLGITYMLYLVYAC